jgi:cob(I)alamin adenosyltransferase
MSIRITRVYTRVGDDGLTQLVGGQRVPKDSVRIQCYGTVDELNCILGLARTANRDPGGSEESREQVDAILERVQNELFNLGSDLATPVESRHPKQPVIEPRHVDRLEQDIDRMNAELPALNSFVLPGGGWVAGYLHQARTVCRRAERWVVALAREEKLSTSNVPYLNRLSDMLFVMARWSAARRGEAEPLWRPEST